MGVAFAIHTHTASVQPVLVSAGQTKTPHPSISRVRRQVIAELSCLPDHDPTAHVFIERRLQYIPAYAGRVRGAYASTLAKVDYRFVSAWGLPCV